MADEDGTVAAIYELADQPLDTRAKDAMARFCVDHPRGRHGAVDYRSEDLGLDEEAVAHRLRHYRDRFVAVTG